MDGVRKKKKEKKLVFRVQGKRGKPSPQLEEKKTNPFSPPLQGEKEGDERAGCGKGEVLGLRTKRKGVIGRRKIDVPGEKRRFQEGCQGTVHSRKGGYKYQQKTK